MRIVLYVIVGWCAVSVIAGLLVGAFIRTGRGPDLDFENEETGP